MSQQSAHPQDEHDGEQVAVPGTGMAPRTSIRGLQHPWEVDRAPVPVLEIQRIRKRTRELRKSRRSDASDCSSTTTTTTPQYPSKVSPNLLSSVAKDLHQVLLRRRVKSRDVDDSLSTVGMNTSSDASTTTMEQHLPLHDLCGEATTPGDVAWRNAVFLLSKEPHLARNVDSAQHWTPLHICCLGARPPPTFMLHALLYVYPGAASTPDDGGRLPLHLCCASSGDCTTLQLLLQEYPDAMQHVDHHGLTPLLVLLRNHSVQMTLRHVQILMGHMVAQSPPNTSTTRHHHRRKPPLQRRQEHLDMSVQSVQEWLGQTPPVTNFLNHAAVAHEAFFETSPHDVQVSLRKLAQWKQKQSAAPQYDVTAAVMDETRSPAAIPTRNEQYPIHLLVQRAIIDPAPLQVAESLLDEKKMNDDEDDEEVPSLPQQPSVVEAPSILRLLAAACPDALMVRDVDGLTPLLQVIVEEDVHEMEDIADILLGPTANHASWAFDLPLHDTPQNAAMVPLLETGQLPLHLVAEEHSSKLNLMQSLHRAYPGAVLVKDNCGRTPLHLALRTNPRELLETRVVELLYADPIANVTDDYGNRPMDLLLRNGVPRSGASSTVYRRWFAASDAVDVRQLRKLPPWLRAEACATIAVQDKVVDDLAQPWKCALILLDGVLLVALIALFRKQMTEYVAFLRVGDPLAPWFTYWVYATAVLRMFGNLFLGGITLRLGEFRHLCLFNVWYWIDWAAMIVCIASSVALYGNADEEKLLATATASTCLLWLTLVGFLVNWWHGMAVFVGALSKIWGRLVYPLISGGLLFMAFGQCFYILLQVDCTESLQNSEVPVCSERDAYRVVYQLIRGASLISVDSVSELSDGSALLVVSLVVALGLFVLALAVTLLVSTKNLEFEGVALDSFWERKLALVLCSSDFGFDNKRIPVRSDNAFSPGQLERGWSSLARVLWGDQSEERGQWHHLKTGSSNPMDFVWALFVVPLWIFVGAASLGLLWPPQVRRWLFRPTRSPNDEQVITRKDNDKTHMLELRKEIAQSKLMSYEKSRIVEDELRELKQLLVSVLKG